MRTMRSWQAALLALSLAVLSWWYVTGRERIEIWVDLPVVMRGVPEDMTLVNGTATSVKALVRGPSGLMRGLAEKMLYYTLDLTELQDGLNIHQLSAKNVPLPRTVDIPRFDPTRLTIDADKLILRELPVVPVWTGPVAEDVELRTARATPAYVSVRGAETLLDPIKEVRSWPVSVNATAPLLMEAVVPLSLPDSMQVEPAMVRISLDFGVKRVVKELTVPLSVANASQLKARVSPKKIKLHLRMDLPLSERKDLHGLVNAVVNVDAGTKKGTYLVTYRTELPPGVDLVAAEPETVELTLR